MKAIIFGILFVIASSVKAQVEPPSFAQVDLDKVDTVAVDYNYMLTKKGGDYRVFRAVCSLKIVGRQKNIFNKYFVKNAEITKFEDERGNRVVESLSLKDMLQMYCITNNNTNNFYLYKNGFTYAKEDYKSLGIHAFIKDLIKVAEFYKNKIYAEPTDVIKKYAKKKILIEYSDSLGKTTSCTILGKQIAFDNKKVKDAEALRFCLTRLDDLFFNGNDMAQFYHIENKIKPEGKLSIIVDQKDSTEILMKDKVIDADRVMYNDKLYELIDYVCNSQCGIES